MLSQIRVELHNLGAIFFCKYISAEVNDLSRETWMKCFSFQLEVNVAGREVHLEPGVSKPHCKAGTPAHEDLSIQQDLEATPPRNGVFFRCYLYRAYGRLLSPSSVYCTCEVLSCLMLFCLTSLASVCEMLHFKNPMITYK